MCCRWWTCALSQDCVSGFCALTSHPGPYWNWLASDSTCSSGKLLAYILSNSLSSSFSPTLQLSSAGFTVARRWSHCMQFLSPLELLLSSWICNTLILHVWWKWLGSSSILQTSNISEFHFKSNPYIQNLIRFTYEIAYCAKYTLSLIFLAREKKRIELNANSSLFVFIVSVWGTTKASNFCFIPQIPTVAMTKPKLT